MLAGFHVPVIPLVDVVGKDGTEAPAQMESEVPKLNTGVTIGFTVTLKLVVTAHWPASGVNVYIAEFWLSTIDGFQLPLIPLPDVVGNTGTLLPAQMIKEFPKLNEGVLFGLTTTENDVIVAHCPASGVNV